MSNGGQTSDQFIWNAEEASEQLDEATINSLWDEYLQPHSFSTSDSIELAKDEQSEILLSYLGDKDHGLILPEALDRAF